MSKSIVERVYPEQQLFGFTRCDGTTYFLTRVRSLLQPDDTVLDVGCGRGQRIDDACRYRRELQDLTDENRTVIGIDVDPNAASNPFIDQFHLLEDPARWPVADASVNFVYSDYVLEHIPDPISFFS